MKNWIYLVWMLHYSLSKKILIIKGKGLKKVAWNLSFAYTLILTLFLTVLVINKDQLHSLVNSKIPLAPIGGLMVVLILIPIFFMFAGPKSNQKIKVLRKVVKMTHNINPFFSLLYGSFYFVLFRLIVHIMSTH